jgi:hypothetical protein
VDLFDEKTTREEKQISFLKILNGRYITSCDYCSGDYGTSDKTKRYPAAEQLEQ